MSPSETDMFPMIIELTATDNSGSDVEKAIKRKLRTDFFNLRFSDMAIMLDKTMPLAPPSNASPIASNRGDNQNI
jgi:hypothetical protein